MNQSIGTTIVSTAPYILLIGAIIFATIMPQRKRDKQVKQMMADLKKGDWVRTIGGVVGRVYTIKDEQVVLETGPDHVKLTFTRGSIATVGDSEVESEGLTESEIKVATKEKKK